MVVVDVDEKTYQVLTDLKEGRKTPEYYLSKRDWLRGQGVDVDTVDNVLKEKGLYPTPKEEPKADIFAPIRKFFEVEGEVLSPREALPKIEPTARIPSASLEELARKIEPITAPVMRPLGKGVEAATEYLQKIVPKEPPELAPELTSPKLKRDIGEWMRKREREVAPMIARAPAEEVSAITPPAGGPAEARKRFDDLLFRIGIVGATVGDIIDLANFAKSALSFREIYKAITAPYKTLGVPKDASLDEVNARFRELAKRYHPDVSDLPKEEATRKFAEIAAAYHEIVRRITPPVVWEEVIFEPPIYSLPAAKEIAVPALPASAAAPAKPAEVVPEVVAPAAKVAKPTKPVVPTKPVPPPEVLLKGIKGIGFGEKAESARKRSQISLRVRD